MQRQEMNTFVEAKNKLRENLNKLKHLTEISSETVKPIFEVCCNEATELWNWLDTLPLSYVRIRAVNVAKKFRDKCRSIADDIQSNLVDAELHPPRNQQDRAHYKDHLSSLASKFSGLDFCLTSVELDFERQSKTHFRNITVGTSLETVLVQLQESLDRLLVTIPLADPNDILKCLLREKFRSNSDEEKAYLRLLFLALHGPEKRPPEHLCPITLKVMSDPVELVESRVTYERRSIEQMISENPRCPMLDIAISLPVQIIPNEPLKALIADWDRRSTPPTSNSASTNADPHERLPAEANSSHNTSTTTGASASALHSRETDGTISENDQQLLDACRDGNLEMILSSLKAGAKIEVIADEDRSTPLILTTKLGHEECVKALLDAGANCYNGDIRGRTPLHIACAMNKPKIVKVLLGHCIHKLGQMLSACTHDGDTALHIAAVYGYEDIGRILLQKGIYVDARNYKDETPLHIAAERNDIRFCRLLIVEHKADRALKDKNGRTALAFANDRSYHELYSCLRRPERFPA